MRIEEVLTAPPGPWQDANAERLIGSIRRECLNRLIILDLRHLSYRLKDSKRKRSPKARSRSPLTAASRICRSSLHSDLNASRKAGRRPTFQPLPQIPEYKALATNELVYFSRRPRWSGFARPLTTHLVR